MKKIFACLLLQICIYAYSQTWVGVVHTDYYVNKKMAAPTRINCWGNSITMGFGLNAGERWATKLATLLSLTEINNGHSGAILQQTYKGTNTNLGVLYYNLNLIQNGNFNDIVIIEYGVNDVRDQIAGTYGSNLAQFSYDYDRILNEILKPGRYCNRRIFLCSIPYQQYNQQYDVALTYSAVIQALAAKYRVFYYDVMFNFRGDYYLQDGVHPTSIGGTLWANGLYNFILANYK